MSLIQNLAETYIYQVAQSIQARELGLEEAVTSLAARVEWGNPSDGEINQVDTLINDLIDSQREPKLAYILAELNLAVSQVVGSPSQEVICANTVGEAITALKDPRLTPRRIEVYKAALNIVDLSGDELRAAVLYNNLGNAYSELMSGDLAASSQAAVEAYERALTVFTPETQPFAWAGIQNNLATIYKSRPDHDEETIRPAITCWELALTVLTRDTYPLEWATVQRNLGVAYKDLNSGNPVENLKRARDHLLAALEVFTPEVRPVDWAELQNTLGNLYLNLTTGDRSENLQEAIACFDAALTVRTTDVFPVQFATTCVNLGNAWLSLPGGDRADNLQCAIEYYEQALTLYTLQDFPERNAQIHTNLAAAYLYLPAGDRAQNLRRAEHSLKIALNFFSRTENPTRYAWVKSTQGAVYRAMARNDPKYASWAIAAFRETLDVYTKEEFPADYARVMDNLGTLYRALSEEDPQKNRRHAEQCYQAALTVYHAEFYPDDYASTQTNLGNCYLFWPTTDRSQTMSKAIECYQKALRFHSREAFPLDYARTMDALAVAYSLLAGEREEFATAASKCFREALEAATAVGARSEIVRIAGNAGSLFWKQGNWTAAYTNLALAIQTLEDIWDEHYSSAGKSELQHEHPALYSRMVQTCHALLREKDVVDYVERSRSRHLLSLLGETVTPPSATQASVCELLTQVSMLSDDLRSLKAVTHEAESLSAEQILALIRREETLWRERNHFFGELETHLPEYVGLKQGRPLSFDDFRDMLAGI